MNKKGESERKRKKIIGIVFMVTLALVIGTGLLGILVYLTFFEAKTKKGQQAELEKETTKNATYVLPTKEKIKKEEEAVEKAEVPELVKPEGKYTKLLADTAFMEENNIYEVAAQEEDVVTFGFAGDILFDDEYAVMANLLNRGATIENGISDELLARMRGVDVMMVNNEFPFTDRGTKIPEKTFTFRADTDTVSYLHDMGVDIVSLANNHAYDFGEIGLLDTLDTLKKNKIPCVGAGRNLEEAAAPVYFMTDDIKIAVISATQIERLENPDTKGATETSAGVFRCLNPEKLYEVVEKAKETSDFVIVFIHWGTENQAEPDWAQLEQAPKLAESGADLIVGAHSHCLQGIQYYGDTPVIYSLGNFWFNSKTLDAGMVQVEIDKEGLRSFRFVPAIQSDCRVVLAYGEEKDRILNYMRSLSEDVLIDENGYVTKK